MTVSDARPPLEVVIAGAGVAGLEALLGLHDLAGDHVHVTLVDLTRPRLPAEHEEDAEDRCHAEHRSEEPEVDTGHRPCTERDRTCEAGEPEPHVSAPAGRRARS